MKQFLTASLLLICLKGFSQQPIFVTGSTGQLYSLDLANCSSHYVGIGNQYGDIAFTPDGRLWGINSGNLFQIDTTDATYTLIGNFGLPCVSLVGLNDSTLLVESGTDLYGVRNTNLSTYLIGSIGYQSCGDLTWYDNDLYMTTCNLLIKIVLDSTYSTILSAVPVNNSNNPLPSCEGIATASFVGAYNSIIGFDGPNAFKICQIDGTFQTLCPSLVMYGTPGAASIRLPVQVPLPTACQIPTSIVNINSAHSELEIIPNPVSKTGHVQIRFSGEVSFPFTTKLISLQGLTLYCRIEQSSINELEIDLNNHNLVSGTYIIEIESASHQFYSLIIID